MAVHRPNGPQGSMIFYFGQYLWGIKEKLFFKWRQKHRAILPALESAEVSRHRRSGLLRAPITARRRRRTPARGRVRSLQHRHTAKMVTRSRLAIGRRATNKRQTPAPIPPRLFAHMRCWVRRGAVTSHFVEWQGAPVKSVKTGFIGQARKGGRQATTPRRLSCTICGAHSAPACRSSPAFQT
jgi:hypothetical protein